MSTDRKVTRGSTATQGSPVRLTRVGLAQAGQAAEVLAASHANYPAFRSVFPEPSRREQALRRFFGATVRDGIRSGEVYAMTGPRMLGVAVWLPPGAFPWTWLRKVRATPALLRVLAADPGSFRRFAHYGANAEQAHPDDPHWYLVVLGIRPDARRSGYGSRLMEPALERADQDGLASYLETSDRANVAFYRRFGFGVVNDAVALVPDGPTHTAMRRPARQAG